MERTTVLRGPLTISFRGQSFEAASATINQPQPPSQIVRGIAEEIYGGHSRQTFEFTGTAVEAKGCATLLETIAQAMSVRIAAAFNDQTIRLFVNGNEFSNYSVEWGKVASVMDGRIPTTRAKIDWKKLMEEYQKRLHQDI